MKHLKKGSIYLLIILAHFCASAQKPSNTSRPVSAKPKLFRDIPNKVAVPAIQLTRLLKLGTGQPANFSLSEKASFEGTVVSASSKYNNSIRSIVVRSSNLPDASFTFSAITKPDGTVYYRGRIISFQHGDCFELKTENGQFFFEKKDLDRVVNN